jgi:hypothetical protein
MTVNGRKIVYPVSADLGEGDAFIPAISIADALETTIEQDYETSVVTLTSGGKVVQASAGKIALIVNGQAVSQESTPYNKGGYLMLPLNLMTELLGLDAALQ